MEISPSILPAFLSSQGPVLAAAFLLTACSHQPVEYAWSHLESGEYLFAYDARSCEETAREATGSERAKASSHFFTCMQDLGYYLVDPNTGNPMPGSVGESAAGMTDPQAAAD